MLKQCFLRRLGKLCNLPAAVGNAAWRPLERRKGLPRVVEAFFSFRHCPKCVAFVEKRFAPFNDLAIEWFG